VPDVADLRVHIGVDGEQDVARALASANREVTSFAQSANKTGSALGDIGKIAAGVFGGNLIGGAVSKITSGLTGAVASAVQFSSSVSEIGAATQTSGAQLEALRAKALALGKDVQLAGVDAQDAAQAIAELGRGGVSTADILGGAAKGALLLFSAGATSVGEATGVAVKALSIYQEQAGGAAHVADLLAAGANKSSTSIAQLGSAFNQAAGVAKDSGLSIEQLTGTLAFLAQNGLEGSDAGTALRTTLQRLTGPTDVARKVMDDLGISIFDASGAMRPFPEVVDNLKAAFAGLTDEQRGAALQTIGGADAVRVLLPLIREGGGAITEWTAKVNDSGYAAKIGAQRNDNLAASFEQFKATATTGAIEAIAKFEPALRRATDAGTKFIGDFLDSPAVQSGISQFAAAFGTALDTIIAKLGDPTFREGLKDWGVAALDVGKAIASFAQGVGNVLGPVLQAAGLLFGALDDDGRRNVVMFGLAAAAALKYGSALGSAASAVAGFVGRLGALLVAEEGVTASSTAATLSLAGLGTAAGVAGALLIPLAVFAGHVGEDMAQADAAIQKVAKSLDGDLGPAIAKVKAANWEETLVGLFADHTRSTDDAAKAVHDWARGLDGAVPTLDQLNAAMAANGAALMHASQMTREELYTRYAIGRALTEEIDARKAATAAGDAWVAYLNEEQGASDQAAAAAAAHARALFLAEAAYHVVSAEAQAFGQVIREQNSALAELEANGQVTTRAVAGLGNASAIAAARAAALAGAAGWAGNATRDLNINGTTAQGVLNDLGATAFKSSQEFDRLVASQQAVGQQASFYAGQVQVLQGGLDHLNGILQAGRPLSAAQSVAYDQAAHAAASYQVAIAGLTDSQFSSAIAAQRVDAANQATIQRMAVITGAGNDVAASLQGQAARYIDLVAAVESANSALRVAGATHSQLGGEIQDFQGRIAALTQQEKDYAAGKAGVTALTADEAAQVDRLKGLLPGLEAAYRAQAVQVTNLEVAQVLANAAVEESKQHFQAQNAAMVVTGTGMADAALRAGTLTQAQHDLAVAAITSADNAFTLANAINSLPTAHTTHFTVDAAGALVAIDQYGKTLFNIPPQYQTAIANNASDLIPIVNSYGETFLHVPADWVTNISNNAGEEVPVVDQYGRTVAQIPKEWASTFQTNAGELIPVVDAYGTVIKLVPRGQQETSFLANTAGATESVNAFGQKIITLTQNPYTITVNTKFDFVNKYDEFGQLMQGAGGGQGITIPVKADTSAATATLATFTTDLNAVGAKTATPTLTLADYATPALTTPKEGLHAFGATTATATAALLDNASGGIGSLIGAINSVPRTIGIVASVDISGALGAIQTLRDNMPHSPAKEGPFRVLPDWTTVFDTFGEGVTRAIGQLPRLGVAVDSATADLAKKVADAASSVAKAITDTLGALTALSSFDFAKDSPSGATLGWFRHLTESLVATMADAATGFTSEGLKAAGDFADAASKVGGFIKNALDGLGALATYDFASGSPSGDAMGWFAHLVASLVATIAEAARGFGDEALKAATAFSGAAGSVVGIIGNAVDGLSKLADFVAPSQAAIDNFGIAVYETVRKIGEMAGQMSKDGIAQAGALGVAAGSILGALKTALDVFTGLAKLVVPSAQAIDNFAVAVAYTVRKIGTLADQIGKDGIKHAQDFGATVGGIFGALKSAMDVLTNLEQFKDVAAKAFNSLIAGMQGAIQSAQGMVDQAKLIKLQSEEYAALMAQAGVNFAKGMGVGGGASPQEIGRKLGTGVVAGVRDAFDSHSPSRVMAAIGQDAILGLVQGMDAGQQDALQKAAQVASAVADAIAKGLDTLSRLGGFDFTAGIQAGLYGVGKGLRAAVNDFALVAEQVTQVGTDAAGKFADGAGKVADTIGKGVAAFASVAGFADTPAITAGIYALDKALMAAVADFAAVVDTIGPEAATKAGAFADGAGKVVGIIANAVAGFAALPGLVVPGAAAIDAFADTTLALVAAIARVARTLASDGLTAAAGFADTAGKVLGLLGSGVSGLSGLADFRAPTQAAMDAFAATARYLVAAIARVAAGLDHDGLDAAGKFADSAGKVLGMVGAGVTGLKDLFTFVAPAQSAMDAFAVAVRDMVRTLAAVAGTIATEGATAAATFADAAGKVFAGLNAGTSFFKSLDGLLLPDQAGIDRILAPILATVRAVAEAARTFDPATLAATGALADIIARVMAGVQAGNQAFAPVAASGGGGGGGGNTYIYTFNISGPVYGFDQFEDEVVGALEDARRRGRIN
jgi:TP901 family phage tail tape measure protein